MSAAGSPTSGRKPVTRSSHASGETGATCRMPTWCLSPYRLGRVAAGLDGIQGIGGKTMIDATNLIGTEPPAGLDSNAEFVKSRTDGPTAKSFNLNFANQYDKIGAAKSRPSNLWSGDDEARSVVEQLNRDAGYEPVRLGGLDKAATQERDYDLISVVAANMGPFFYRFAPPEQF
jgi:hypothetical protein